MEKLRNKTDALINKILKTWDIKDLKHESIDPVIKLLIACVADETSNLENQINDTTAKVEQILLDSLLPCGLSYSKPAHAIIQALPSESFFDINEKQQYVYDKSTIVNGKKEIHQLIFSPVGEYRIFRSSIEFIYNGETLVSLKDNKHFLPTKIGKNSNSIWIGMSIDESVKSLDNFTFFISTSGGVMNSDVGLNTVLIDRIKLFVGEHELNLDKGIRFNYKYEKGYNADSLYSYNLLSYNNLLKDSFCSYSDYFFKINENNHPNLPLLKSKYPDFLDELFDKQTLDNLVSNLLWLEFRIESSDPEINRKVSIFPNTFPVFNVKSVSTLLSQDELIKKIPLGIQDELVGVIGFKVFNGFHAEIEDLDMKNTPFLLREMDMEKFSDADSIDLIEKLIKRFETDRHAFPEHFKIDSDLINELRKVVEKIHKEFIEIKSKQNNHNRAQYLIFKPEEIGETDSLEINCIVTNGGFANNISQGEKLRTSNSLVKQGSISFVNRSRGGRDRLSSDEKKKAINYMLVSSNQLITREDITGFCYFELGDSVKSVSINDSIINTPVCFRKCIKIEIVLYKLKTELDDIPFLAKELENKIRLQSNFIVPLIVSISCF